MDCIDRQPEDSRASVLQHPGRKWLLLHHPDPSFRYLNVEEVDDAKEMDREELKKKILLITLVFIAIIADGYRPILLYESKNGQPKFPYMFPTWLIMVLSIRIIFYFFKN